MDPRCAAEQQAARCILADAPIGSPFVDRLDAALVLNPPSLAKFQDLVRPGGVLVIDESLIESDPRPDGVRVVRLQCTREARAAGSERVTSVVALGALIGATGWIDSDTARAALREMVERKHPETLAGNLRAFDAGLRAAAATAEVA